MQDEQLHQLLQDLRPHAVDTAWVSRFRGELTRRIASPIIRIPWWERPWAPVSRWSFAGAVAAVVLLASGGTAAAAQRAMPGSPLYPVKRVTERVQLAIARRPARIAAVRVALAERRFDELAVLTVRPEPPAAIAAAAEHYAAALHDVDIAVTTAGPSFHGPARERWARAIVRQSSAIDRVIEVPAIPKEQRRELRRQFYVEEERDATRMAPTVAPVRRRPMPAPERRETPRRRDDGRIDEALQRELAPFELRLAAVARELAESDLALELRMDAERTFRAAQEIVVDIRRAGMLDAGVPRRLVEARRLLARTQRLLITSADPPRERNPFVRPPDERGDRREEPRDASRRPGDHGERDDGGRERERRRFTAPSFGSSDDPRE